MPKTTKTSKPNYKELDIFSGSRQVLNLIIISFIALSCLLVMTVVSQSDELSFYKSQVAGTNSNR